MIDGAWTGLRGSGAAWLLLTLLAWHAAHALSRRFAHPVWASPPLLTIVAVAVVLLATGAPYAAYFAGGQYLHFLLGPATVALAVPLYANLDLVRRSGRAILPALAAGSTVTIVAAVVLARWLGAPRAVVLALATKSVTTPIAIGIAGKIGAPPALATVFVILAGLVGILVSAPLFRVMRLRDPRAEGFAAGAVAHGLATAHLLTRSEIAGSFGGLAIGLNGVLSSLLVPLLARVLAR